MSRAEPTFSEIDDVDIPKQEAFAANQSSWDERAAIHSNATSYRVREYLTDPTAMSTVVGQDLPLRLRDMHRR